MYLDWNGPPAFILICLTMHVVISRISTAAFKFGPLRPHHENFSNGTSFHGCSRWSPWKLLLPFFRGVTHSQLVVKPARSSVDHFSNGGGYYSAKMVSNTQKKTAQHHSPHRGSRWFTPNNESLYFSGFERNISRVVHTGKWPFTLENGRSCLFHGSFMVRKNTWTKHFGLPSHV